MGNPPEPNFDVSAYPPLPAARGVFVTGTDTEVGKTLIAGAIARHLHAGRRRVGVFKPAASGCRAAATGELVSDDAAFLAACAGRPHGGELVCPQRFAEPLAPNVAAGRAGTAVDLAAIFAAYRQVADDSECVVVEGVGGLLCPITDDFWVIHLAMLCRLPVVIVARADLGTINHTLLTLHAARSAGLAVAGVIVNRYPRGDAGAAASTNPEQIAARGAVDVLAIVPDDLVSSVEAARIGPATQAAVDAVDWAAIAGARR